MRYSQQSEFFIVIQKQETTKTINYNFFATTGKLEDIANRHDSLGTALISSI